MLKTTIAILLTLSFTQGFGADKYKCSSKPYSLGISNSHNHEMFAPQLKRDSLVKRDISYIAVFDGLDDDNGDGKGDSLANPTFVAYQLKGVKPNNQGQYIEPKVSIQRPRWYKEQSLSFLWGSKKGIDNSYSGIGKHWNRGHWLPADHAQRISAQASCNTHTFYNASPQAADINQGPWRILENFSAALSNRYGDAWIVTGPIFDNNEILYIGDAGETPVAVPDALFKIIFVNDNGALKYYPFIVEQPHTKSTPPMPTSDYKRCGSYSKREARRFIESNLVTISEIESRTDMIFLANIEQKYRNQAIRTKLPAPDLDRKYFDPYVSCIK
jgi:DNA/RNA endonuclease G (NUC1)